MSSAADRVRRWPMLRFVEPLSGLIVWSVQFAIIYGVTSVACALGYADARLFGVRVIPLTIVVATVVALAVVAFVFVRALGQRRRMTGETDATDRFLNVSTILISGLSLVTIVWHGLPALILPVCW